MAAPNGHGRSPLSPRPTIFISNPILFTITLINHSYTHTAYTHHTLITPRRATSTGFIFYSVRKKKCAVSGNYSVFQIQASERPWRF